MKVSRQHVVDLLHLTGLEHLADEAVRQLPDPVEYDRAAGFLERHGVSKDDLISLRGGSP
jgi:hypothetical protein